MFLIAIIQALPIFIVGLLTKNKIATIITALCMTGVAISIGHKKYLGVDLAFIILFLFAGLAFSKSKSK